MVFKHITKLLGIIFFGILSGGVFGGILALCILGVIHLPGLLLFFAFLVSLFYLVSIWRQLKQRNYLMILRRFIEIIFYASLLNTMFLLEEGLMEFNSFEWNIIYFCLIFTWILFTFYFFIESYFAESWLNKEINHVVYGMQIYGLLSLDENTEDE